MNKKKRGLKSIFTKLIACILALTMVFPTFAAGGPDGDTGGPSTSTGDGSGPSAGTLLATADSTGMKLSILLSPKTPGESDPDKLYQYRAGYYAKKTPVGLPPGTAQANDVSGGYPIYFIANQGTTMEGIPIYGNSKGQVTRVSYGNYIVGNGSNYSSDAEIVAMLNKIKTAMSINWMQAQSSLITKLGLEPVTDDLPESVRESRKDSNAKVFKAMGAAWYKLYPNEITKAIMETGYYETETEEAIILMEPILTISPKGDRGTQKYSITMLNFVNLYLYSRSSKQDITDMADMGIAYGYMRKSPLSDSFRVPPTYAEGHNNVSGALIGKGDEYVVADSIVSKIFYQGPLEQGYANKGSNKHGFGILRGLDWISGTSSTVFYGLGNLEGQSGGSCLYIKQGSVADGLSSLLMNADKFKLQGSSQEIIAQMIGVGRKAYGGAAALSSHMSAIVNGLSAVGITPTGGQQQYPTAAQLSGSGTKIDETEVALTSDEKGNSVVISPDLAALYSDTSNNVTTLSYGLFHLRIGNETAPVQQYTNALSFIYNKAFKNIQTEVLTELKGANAESSGGKYYSSTMDRDLIYGTGTMGSFKALKMRHNAIRTYAESEFTRIVTSSDVIDNYPLAPNATATQLLNGQGVNIELASGVGTSATANLDDEIQLGSDLISSLAFTQEDVANVLLQGSTSVIVGNVVSRKDISQNAAQQEKVKGASVLSYALTDKGVPVNMVFVRIENGSPVAMNVGSSGQSLPLGFASTVGVLRSFDIPTTIYNNSGTEYKLQNVAVKSPGTDLTTFATDLATAINEQKTSIATNGFEVPIVKVNQTAKVQNVKIGARPEDNGAASPITIVAVLQADSGVTVVETYTNDKGNHIKTTIEALDKETLEIADKPSEKAKVKEWFTSTVTPIGIDQTTPWSTINQAPRNNTPGSQGGTGPTTLDLKPLTNPKVVYISYEVEEETIDGGGSSDARYISFQQTLTDLKLNPYYLVEGTNTGYTINNAPFGNHTVFYPFSACDDVCSGHIVYKNDDCESDTDYWTDSNGVEHSDTDYWCGGHTEYYHGACVICCKGHPCVFSSWIDPGYEVRTEDTKDHATNFIADKTLPLYSFSYGNNKKAGTLPQLPTIGEITLQIVAHRGEDKVTIAKYKPLGTGSSDLGQLGYATSNIPTPAQRKTALYKRSSQFEWREVGNDLDISAKCNGNQEHQGKMWANKDTGFEIKIDVYRDKENKGIAKATKLNPTSITVVDKEVQNVEGVVAVGEVIGFYPYVEMLYETTSNADVPVYVLSDEKSYYQVNDYAEIGWTKPRENNLFIKSNQFSTHKSATNGSQWRQANKVLPGGAIFGVTNDGAYTTVGLVTYQTYIPSDILAAVGNEYNLNGLKAADKVTVHTTMWQALKTQLQTIGLEMLVNKNWNSGLSESQGAVIAKSGATLNLDYSRKLSTDNKYWYSERNGAAKNTDRNFDTQDTGDKKTYYKVQALPTKFDNTSKGEIVISKSSNGSTWSEVARYGKDKTGTQIVSSLPSEIKEVNDRTLFVTNFVDAMSRTSGWYSEAWDGICVLKQENTLNFGLIQQPTRLAVVDPKLTPKQDNISDMWSKAFAMGFRSEKKTITVPFKGSASITVKDVAKMQSSEAVYVPNTTVTDLDR